MEEFLRKMVGKTLDVYCGGGSSLRGEVLGLENGVLHLRDTDLKSCYVAVNKIVVVWEARDSDHKAGFLPNTA